MLTSQHLANSLKASEFEHLLMRAVHPDDRLLLHTSAFQKREIALQCTAMQCPACLVQVSFCQLSVQSLHSLAHEVSHYVSVTLKTEERWRTYDMWLSRQKYFCYFCWSFQNGWASGVLNSFDELCKPSLLLWLLSSDPVHFQAQAYQSMISISKPSFQCSAFTASSPTARRLHSSRRYLRNSCHSQ